MTSGACLGHIVNNGQQSAVLHASVMPFFLLQAARIHGLIFELPKNSLIVEKIKTNMLSLYQTFLEVNVIVSTLPCYTGALPGFPADLVLPPRPPLRTGLEGSSEAVPDCEVGGLPSHHSLALLLFTRLAHLNTEWATPGQR